LLQSLWGWVLTPSELLAVLVFLDFWWQHSSLCLCVASSPSLSSSVSLDMIIIGFGTYLVQSKMMSIQDPSYFCKDPISR
jgi:hypothetical protein